MFRNTDFHEVIWGNWDIFGEIRGSRLRVFDVPYKIG